MPRLSGHNSVFLVVSARLSPRQGWVHFPAGTHGFRGCGKSRDADLSPFSCRSGLPGLIHTFLIVSVRVVAGLWSVRENSNFVDAVEQESEVCSREAA
jgi:hypothetical protein